MSIDVKHVEGINEHETEFLYDEIFVRTAYMAEGVELPEHAVVFDVGANIGMYSLFVHSVCPTARIYAFEPLPPIYDKLRRNVATHGVSATLFPHGLSDTDRELPFTYYPGYSTMSVQSGYADTAAERAFIRRQVASDDGPEAAEELELLDELLEYQFRETSYPGRVRRLSDVLDEQEVSRVDMLKIDVQRAEIDVLRGLEERHWPLVRQIAMEVHDESGTPTEGNLSRVVTTLEQRGFRVRTAQDGQLAGTERYALFALRPR